MNRSAIKNINDSLTQIIIPHPQYKDALQRGKSLLGRSELGLSSTGFFLHGKSGVGKTTFINDLSSFGTKKFGEDAIIKTTLTGSLNFTQIISSILTALGDPLSHTGTGNRKLERLINALKARRTQLVIIDEFQHMFSTKNIGDRILNDVGNAIKSLSDHAGVSFLISGTDEILVLWDHDFQLRTRFQRPVSIRSFRYPEDRPVWRGIVKAFLKILNQNDFDIECEHFDDKLFNATHGHMRSTVKLLKEAVVIAASGSRNKVIITDLELAASSTIDERDGRFNSFSDNVRAIEQYSAEVSSIKLAPRTPCIGDVIAQR